jgi:hypothetical protein
MLSRDQDAASRPCASARLLVRTAPRELAEAAALAGFVDAVARIDGHLLDAASGCGVDGEEAHLTQACSSTPGVP